MNNKCVVINKTNLTNLFDDNDYWLFGAITVRMGVVRYYYSNK